MFSMSFEMEAWNVVWCLWKWIFCFFAECFPVPRFSFLLVFALQPYIHWHCSADTQLCNHVLHKEWVFQLSVLFQTGFCCYLSLLSWRSLVLTLCFRKHICSHPPPCSGQAYSAGRRSQRWKHFVPLWQCCRDSKLEGPSPGWFVHWTQSCSFCCPLCSKRILHRFRRYGPFIVSLETRNNSG